MYELPYGNTQQLNLDWFIKHWKEFYAEWQETEAGIDHALDAEIQRVEDAMTDLYAARDAAAASATAAAASASSASNSATTATNAATAAAASATLANNKATAAGLSEAAAANSANSASNSATAAATSASQANASAASATTDAQSATASATAASNSATAAATSETNAAASETAAAASAQRAEDAAAAAQAGGVVKSVENVPIASVDDALAENAVELVVGIEPIQAGTGDPAPDNVRPITGWTGANVSRTGKNVIDIPNLSGASVSHNQMTQIPNGFRLTKTQASSAYSPRIFYLPDWVAGKTITFSADITITGTQNGGIRAIAYSSDYTQKANYGDVSGTSGRISKTITFPDSLPSDADGFAINFYCAYSTPANVGDYTDYTNVMAELSSTATEYEAYQFTTIPITFPDAAGTVYGGTLTINEDGSGELRVTMAEVDMGTLGWVKTTNSQGIAMMAAYPTGITVGVIGVNSLMCSAYNAIPTINAGIATDTMLPNGSVCQSVSGTSIRVRDDNYTDAALFKAAVSGVQLVYELATPIEYTLTESQVVTLLNGINNVWADTGNINLLRYYANSKGYIDAQDALVKALIAKELDDMIADTALNANDFRIVNNTLYRITAPIASGATLTPNTNCTATTVGEILKTLLT